MELQEIVSRNPRVLNGDLVFAGTRVPVENLVDYLAAGDTLDEFLENFPGVSREQVEGYLRMTMEVTGERLAVDEAADEGDDPILGLGQEPVHSGAGDGSENHDLYLYGG
jgi:uncharacterized protein (DUF433 family)